MIAGNERFYSVLYSAINITGNTMEYDSIVYPPLIPNFILHYINNNTGKLGLVSTKLHDEFHHSLGSLQHFPHISILSAELYPTCMKIDL